MGVPTARLQAVRSSTTALVQWLESLQWSDSDVRAASVLPGWSRGHVLTHIARNADGMSYSLSAALRGEDVPRYPHGVEGRNADIEAGSSRTATELIADVRDSADRLDRVFGAVSEAGLWDASADNQPAHTFPTLRWREVEIHRADLDAGFTPEQWPAEFVEYLLPALADRLGERDGLPALHIVVAADGSASPSLVGREWTVAGADAGADEAAEGAGAKEAAEGAAVEVAGPDWALASWLVGRPGFAATALSEVPDVTPWKL